MAIVSKTAFLFLWLQLDSLHINPRHTKIMDIKRGSQLQENQDAGKAFKLYNITLFTLYMKLLGIKFSFSVGIAMIAKVFLKDYY